MENEADSLKTENRDLSQLKNQKLARTYFFPGRTSHQPN